MPREVTSADKVFTVGEQAWQNLDENRKRPRLTAGEAKAYLDWRVKKVPMVWARSGQAPARHRLGEEPHRLPAAARVGNSGYGRGSGIRYGRR